MTKTRPNAMPWASAAQTAVPKHRRKQLAKAELWVFVAMQVGAWAKRLRGQDDKVIPPEQWPADDPFIALCRTYGLTFEDLAKIADQIADQAEGRGEANGYADHWDDPAESRD